MESSTIASSRWASMSSSQPSGQPMCSVPSPRWLRRDGNRLEDPLDVVAVEALLDQALTRARLHERLRARARGHALGGDAGEPPRPGLAGHGDAVQRVDLLREDPAVRRRLVLRVAGLQPDLGAARALAVADLLGDVLGQRLRPERALAEDDLADRVVDDLLEARHVRALLPGAQVDEAVELRGVERLGPAGGDPDDLLDVGDAHARERDVQRRDLVLDVVERDGHDCEATHSSPLGVRSSPPLYFRSWDFVLQVTN
jgi:hypothetical protein